MQGVKNYKLLISNVTCKFLVGSLPGSDMDRRPKEKNPPPPKAGALPVNATYLISRDF